MEKHFEILLPIRYGINYDEKNTVLNVLYFLGTGINSCDSYFVSYKNRKIRQIEIHILFSRKQKKNQQQQTRQTERRDG